MPDRVGRRVCLAVFRDPHQWATSGITPVWRAPGEAGVRARVHADIRRRGTTQ
ncbi:DUF6207 family protein [Streptomyces sp. NPDC058409]|uniref:DUF6207 family protein n=1 Tax=Streptomyces sp. NPDC058409 TaxID=3346484 RepID=UPI003669681C